MLDWIVNEIKTEKNEERGGVCDKFMQNNRIKKDLKGD